MMNIIMSGVPRVRYNLHEQLGILLNALRAETLQRMVNVLWSYKLEGITEPTAKQLLQYSINQARNKEELEAIRNAINKLGTLESVYDLPEHMEGNQSDRESVYTLSVNSSNDLLITLDGVTAQLPLGKTSLLDVEKIALQLGLPIHAQVLKLSSTSESITHYLHSLTTIALREFGVIDGRVSTTQQATFGEKYFQFYTQVVSGSGRVLSSNASRRWFYEDYDNGKTISKLLVKDSRYSAGNYAMAFKPTDLGNQVMHRVIELFKVLDFKSSDITVDPRHHIRMDRALIDSISYANLIILLRNTVGFHEGSFIIDINKLDTLTDRVYSVFTSINAQTRATLGYINYDINAAMPTISMQLLPDWECDPDTPLYPLHQQIIEDRKGFRTEVMHQTGRSEDWVKKELSKLDNMDHYNTSFEILEDYFQEGLSIRDSVINRVQQSNPKMYHTAFSKAKNIINKTWDEELKQMRFIPTEEKKESSVFFFIWTQVERVIREAMKSVFQDQQSVIDCHDAVYSKEKVDIKAMEQAVLDQTGFVVKISH